MTEIPCCPYCAQPAELVPAWRVYQCSARGNVWLCMCKHGWAWADCLYGTDTPARQMADECLRFHRRLAIEWFDRVRDKCMRWERLDYAYAKMHVMLKKHMVFDGPDPNIGYMEIGQCFRVIDICRAGLLENDFERTQRARDN